MALFNRYKRLGDPFGQIPDDEMQDDGLPEVYGTTTQQPDEDRPAFDPPPPPPPAEAAPVQPAPPKPSMAAGSMDKAKGIDPVAAAPVPPPGMAGAPQPPKSQAQIAFDELNALKQPERPQPNKWQKLAAVGLGGLQGFNNADPRRRPMDLADSQQAVLLGPKYIKDERQYEQKKADLQNKIKTADQVENIASMADTRNMNAQTRLNNEKDRAQANTDRVNAAKLAEQDRQNKVVSDLVSKGGQRVPLETPTPAGMIEIPDPLHEVGPDGRPKFKAVIDPHFGQHQVTPEQSELSGGALKPGDWIDKAALTNLIQAGAGKYDKKDAKLGDNTLLELRAQGKTTGIPQIDALSPKEAGTSLQRLKPPPNVSSTSVNMINPAALDQAAEMYAATGQMPSVGFGKSAAEMRSAIMNRAATLHPSANLAEAKTDYSANQGAIKNLERQRAQVLTFENTATRNLDIADEISKKVDRTGSPVVNKFLLHLKGQYGGDTDTQLLNNVVETAASEYAKVVSGGGASQATTDSARAHARDMLTSAMSKGTFSQAVALMKREMESRKAGYDDQLRELHGGRHGEQPQQHQQSGGTVNMRAPNGQVRPVPADQVEHFKQRGAVVVQ